MHSNFSAHGSGSPAAAVRLLGCFHPLLPALWKSPALKYRRRRGNGGSNAGGWRIPIQITPSRRNMHGEIRKWKIEIGKGTRERRSLKIENRKWKLERPHPSIAKSHPGRPGRDDRGAKNAQKGAQNTRCVEGLDNAPKSVGVFVADDPNSSCGDPTAWGCGQAN